MTYLWYSPELNWLVEAPLGRLNLIEDVGGVHYHARMGYVFYLVGEV